MITNIIKAYVREYTDTGQIVAYVEFTDLDGKLARIEGERTNLHMRTLFDRARREGIAPTFERW